MSPISRTLPPYRGTGSKNFVHEYEKRRGADTGSQEFEDAFGLPLPGPSPKHQGGELKERSSAVECIGNARRMSNRTRKRLNAIT